MIKFFDEERESLVGYYLLPLLGLSKNTFGQFYQDAKITRDRDAIVVYLYPGCKEPFWENENYQTDYTVDRVVYAVFAIPKEWKEDIDLFCEGKYSRMSELAKSKIYKSSGLTYNKQIDKFIVTDMRLLALTRSPILKQWMRENYKIISGANVECIRLKNKDIIYHNL